MLCDAGRDGTEDVVLIDRRKHLFRIFFVFGLERRFETLLDSLPAFLSDRFAFALELIAFA